MKTLLKTDEGNRHERVYAGAEMEPLVNELFDWCKNIKKIDMLQSIALFKLAGNLLQEHMGISSADVHMEPHNEA